MKRNLIVFVLVLYSCTIRCFAQHTFSINAVDISKEKTSAYLEIYVSDEYFHFDKDDKPVAKIQAENNIYHYELPIEEMRAVKICSYDKNNQFEGAVERFADGKQHIFSPQMKQDATDDSKYLRYPKHTFHSICHTFFA